MPSFDIAHLQTCTRSLSCVLLLVSMCIVPYSRVRSFKLVRFVVVFYPHFILLSSLFLPLLSVQAGTTTIDFLTTLRLFAPVPFHCFRYFYFPSIYSYTFITSFTRIPAGILPYIIRATPRAIPSPNFPTAYPLHPLSPYLSALSSVITPSSSCVVACYVTIVMS